MDRRNHVWDAESHTPEPSEEREFAQFEPYAVLILYAIGVLIVLLCGPRQGLHELPRALAAEWHSRLAAPYLPQLPAIKPGPGRRGQRGRTVWPVSAGNGRIGRLGQPTRRTRGSRSWTTTGESGEGYWSGSNRPRCAFTSPASLPSIGCPVPVRKALFQQIRSRPVHSRKTPAVVILEVPAT